MLEALGSVSDFRPIPPPCLEGSARSPPSRGSDNLFYPGGLLGINRNRHGDRLYTYVSWQNSKMGDMRYADRLKLLMNQQIVTFC